MTMERQCIAGAITFSSFNFIVVLMLCYRNVSPGYVVGINLVFLLEQLLKS